MAIHKTKFSNKMRGWTEGAQKNSLLQGARVSLLLSALAIGIQFFLASCGSTSGGSTPPPPTIMVTVSPSNMTLSLGQSQQFQASVTGTSNTTVTWQVNGVPGGSASNGTISSTGMYAAPTVLPSPPSATITAVSVADPQASNSAAVMLQDNISVSVTPGMATLPAGGTQLFTANVKGAGSASTAVNWSVNAIAGGNSTVGTVLANGADSAMYTAPAAPPASGGATVTAISLADSSKTGSASVTITCSATNSITPGTAIVALGATQTFTVSFCLPTGTAISWDVNGIAGGNTTVGTIAGNGAAGALYTAPADLPTSNLETVHAKAGTTTASATVTLTDSITVSISPSSLSMAVNQKDLFTSSVSGTSDAGVSWFVNGIANGNASVGQICVAGSNPCAAPQGPAAGNVSYLAPMAIPAVNPVTLTAASHADATKTGTALVIITGSTVPVGVTLVPPYAFVPPSTGTLSKQQFYAQITGTSNTSVTWKLQSAVSGQGCGGTACGSVDASGLYTAPTAAPSPNAITITATSQADTTKSASAALAITSGPVIEALLPSSAMAGAVESFPLEVQGVNFVGGSGSTASMILINGTARGTACQTATTCATALNPTDLQTSGTLTVQVQNPGPPSTLSNPVPFVIVPFDASEDSIVLSASAPTATGKNIIVTDPTTAAASATIDVDFVGYFTGGNTCGVQGSPLTVTRPASGTTSVTICVHGNGLDPTFTYTFTGPPGGDIGVTASSITGGFPNTIGLQLQISSTTLPGARTLVITTLNGDRATATGMLEVE